MGIVRFALRWPYTFYVLALLILFLGVTAFRSMPADIFPEIDIPVVTVIWQYTGISAPARSQHAGDGAARHDLQRIRDEHQRQRHQGYGGTNAGRHLGPEDLFSAGRQ